MRILVIANETAATAALRQHVVGRARRAEADVLVVAPALIGRLDYWASDDRRARRAAEERLLRSLEALRRHGIVAAGYVGDSDPIVAIEDALRLFPADEIVISTHPDGRSNWLARNVVVRARDRFGAPVHHLEAAADAGTAFVSRRAQRVLRRLTGGSQRRAVPFGS
jgi:hypothetical protein